jgi:hypothetical protein
LKINFLGVVPESRFSSRNTHGASVPPSPIRSGEEGVVRGELRLRVLLSLPATHQRYLFEKVSVLCSTYLRKEGVPLSELTPRELLSEVWLKLLGTASLDETEEFTGAAAPEWTLDPQAPERDGRVVWLVQEIGGAGAIAHRHEDIRRERFGRAKPEVGRPIVQPGVEDETAELGSDPNQAITLQQKDADRAWRGLLATANKQFQQRDDVSMLLRLMNDVRDILEDSSSQWPVNRIVALLNQRFPPPTWTDRRVDNAKRRLVNWINRLMQKNGLDATDLEALFARVARREEDGKRLSLTALHRPKRIN